MNHERNYRMTLPLGVIFGLVAIASFVTFLVYATEWSDHQQTNMNDTTAGAVGENSRRQQNRKTKVEYSYQATVLSLLVLLVFFNGYHLTKFRM